MIKPTSNTFPPQHQEQAPGLEERMDPQPLVKGQWYRGSAKLQGKTALITGGDSGIGRAVAIFYARERADVAIIYLNEHQDAEDTKRMVEAEGGRCIAIDGDVQDSQFCKRAVEKTIEQFGHLDILVNNAAYQEYQEKLENLDDVQLERIFRTNIFSYFFMTREALKHMKEGSVIINTTSVTAYRGSSHLLDYASTKAAIVGFTRSLSLMLADRGIRVNEGALRTGLSNAAYVADLQRLADADLELDVNGGPTLLPEVGRLATAFPTLRIVINHLANTRIDGKTVSPTWRADLEAAAKFPRVFLKVSALVEAPGRTTARPSATWSSTGRGWTSRGTPSAPTGSSTAATGR